MAEPGFVSPHPRRGGERRRLTRAISAVLGVDPAEVTVTDDDSRAYQFIPRVGTEDQFMILAPCPDCHAIVPVAEIYDLTDLGLCLDQMTAHEPNTPAAGIRHRPRPPPHLPPPHQPMTPPRRTRTRPLSATPLQHATVAPLADATATAQAIGRAATAALGTTR